MSRPSRARVTAVVVTAGAGEDALRTETLAALAAQTVAPDRVLLVRAAGSDADPDAGSEVEVIDAPSATALGPAVLEAIEQAAVDEEWLWLLHDDSAPEPGALAALLQAVETGRSIAIAGSKQVSWSHPDRLVSVGVQYTRDMQRYTGIEDGEVDQGQHDSRDDVDAVGTAGMLVRREVFLELAGPDPALGPFGDGRDLSRRARLAGHRVVVVPTAVVRHARAGYLGLRTGSRAAPSRAGSARATQRAPARRAAEPDPQHSFRARRTSILHARLVEAPPALLPVIALAALFAGPARAVGRLASKELRLVGDELLAPLAALAGVGAVRRARLQARRTRSVSPRRLRPLAAGWGDIARVRRDRRLQAAAQRRTVRAPSELEMRERASLGTRRRLVLAAVALVAVVVAAVTLAPIAFAGPLLGGALLPADVDFGELWRAATSPWLAGGDGWAVPADPFLSVLGVLSLLTGGPLGTPVWVTTSIVVAVAIPAAALTAWFAAGSATRSLALRAWAALTWALAPPLVLSLASGRLGALVAHVMLPLVVLGIARAFGLDRRDVVVSGLVGARRVEARGVTAPAVEVRKRRLAALAAVGEDAPTGQIARVLAGEGAAAPAAEVGAEPDEPQQVRDGAASALGADDDGEPIVIGSNTAEPHQDDEEEFATIVARPSGVGSIGAAAGAGLALAAVVAGAPVLLPAALLCLALLAMLLGPRRSLVAGRARLLLVAIPPVVLLGPLLTHAARTDDGWRLLVSGPGAPTPTPTGDPLLTLLGWPQVPTAATIGGLTQWLVIAASATVALAALVALARGGGLARGVRLAWLVAAVGVAAAVLAPRVPVGLAQTSDGDPVLAFGWAGPGTSLVVLGLVMATVVAGGGLRSALHGRSFGWRQLGVAVVSAVLVAGVAIAALGWSVMLRGDAVALVTRQTEPVPAIGTELQGSADRARVLAVWSTPAGVIDAALWRGEGPQLTESSSAVALAGLDAGPDDGTALDPATAALTDAVAGLATGTIDDAAATLASHGVAVVVVPGPDSVVTSSRGEETGRDRLVATLDGIRGLERVTENDSGVVWRVSAQETTAARVVVVGADGVASPVPAQVVGVRTELAPVADGATLVLAERAGAGWRAWLDGTPLRAVSVGWQQAFAVPPGAQGELVVRYDEPAHTPWRLLIAATFVAVALIALPTRRRRLDPVEDE